MRQTARHLSRAARWLARVYALELAQDPAHFLLPAERARAALPPGSPRTGLLVSEAAGVLDVAIYVDPGDADDPDVLLEEASHWTCVAWHAARDRPVSVLALELQAEIDRFLHARSRGRDPFAHFVRFRWAPWLSAVPGRSQRARYEQAHRAGERLCRRWQRRYPRPADLPRLVAELRDFYRSSPQAKLQAAA